MKPELWPLNHEARTVVAGTTKPEQERPELWPRE